MNYYLVNLSIADLMITAWCPVNSLVKELSKKTDYILPAVFCKVGGFYTGEGLFINVIQMGGRVKDDTKLCGVE